MSDTRNHTTRDQLADTIDAHSYTYPDSFCSCHAFVTHATYATHLADVLLASDAIAAVRAAAVAETTAAIEAALYPCSLGLPPGFDCRDITDERWVPAMWCQSCRVRAALSGGRTALCSHPHWEEEGDESGSHGVWVCTTCGEASSVTESAEEQPR